MSTFNQEQDFIKDFPRLSKAEIMAKYNLTQAKYDRIRIKNNLKKRMSDADIKFIQDNYLTMTDEEMSKVLGWTVNGIYNRRKQMRLLRDSRYAKRNNIHLDREYTICIWWLTGDAVEDIKLLYNGVRGVNVEASLKNKKKMAKAIHRIRESGCFPIVRTEREIFNMSGLDVTLK